MSDYNYKDGGFVNEAEAIQYRIDQNIQYDYAPDRWEIVDVNKDLKKVFACWYGGYGGSDTWQMSSGVTKVEDLGDAYLVTNHSGSVYLCYKNSRGMSAYGSSVFNSYKKKLEAIGHTFEIVEISVTDEI